MPSFKIEKSTNGIVAGVDEAGRGPWAGPVIAAAVIADMNDFPEGINDSKKLSSAKREALFWHIMEKCKVGVGMASAQEIDELNILHASLLAMQRAVGLLPSIPDLVLIDGNKAPKLQCKTMTIIKGDSKSLSIAAASIIAKVKRDRIMAELASQHPHYGWEKNAGYGTKLHQDGIASHGITPHHRRSFRPVREVVEGMQATSLRGAAAAIQ